jgi:hypothetical protein
MSSYHDELAALAASIGSDGCTKGMQVHVDCCWEHDWSYVTGSTPRGVPTTKAQADRRFRDCNQAHSPLRWLSPWAWLRWTAVHVFGGGPKVLTPVTVRGLVYGPAYRRGHVAAAIAEAQAARRRMI